MLVTVNATISGKKHHFQCDALTYIENTGSYRSVVKLIELVGSKTATRAVWANIVKHREGNYTTNTDVRIKLPGLNRNFAVEPDTKFISRRIGDSFVVFDKGFTQEERRYFMGGTIDVPSPHFVDALRTQVDYIPILAEWAQYLWANGIDDGLIKPLSVYGSPIMAWEIKAGGWTNLVTEKAKQWQD